GTVKSLTTEGRRSPMRYTRWLALGIVASLARATVVRALTVTFPIGVQFRRACMTLPPGETAIVHASAMFPDVDGLAAGLSWQHSVSPLPAGPKNALQPTVPPPRDCG